MNIIQSDAIALKEILSRREESQMDVSETVLPVINQVRKNGDVALKEYTKQFDGVELENLRVSEQEIKDAVQKVDDNFLDILHQSAENIRDFHKNQVKQGFIMAEKEGIILGQKVTPLEKVGVYVPGGTATYPSTVLMDVIPAKIAGVKQIVMVSPPGQMNPDVLAAASIAGVTDIFCVGGAQAIAALAYGTQSIPKVDKIVGPGNIYVATAKKLVYGQVDIDMIAGPSEILIVADKHAVPEFVAADLLSQAEHDKLASAVLITDSEDLAKKVQLEVDLQLKALSRKEIAQASIENNGKILLTKTIHQAIEYANMLAPEHLELCVQNPFEHLPQVQNAGSIFLGNYTPEPLGDYFAGPNHTLPTSGTARFSSPLSVDDFVKRSSYSYYSKQALTQVATQVETFAKREGLDAHANSVAIRTKAKN